MLTTPYISLGNQFQVASSSASSFDFIASSQKLIFAIYNSKNLYIATYNTQGKDLDYCLVKNNANYKILDIKIKMLNSSSVAMIWLEKNKSTSQYAVKGQIVDVIKCVKLQNEKIIMPEQSLSSKPLSFEIITYPEKQIFDLISKDHNIIQCSAQVCKISFDYQCNNIPNSIVEFGADNTITMIALKNFQNLQNAQYYMMTNFVYSQTSSAFEVAASIFNQYGKLDVTKIMTKSGNEMIKARKDIGVIEVNNMISWLCVKEDDTRTAQIECSKFSTNELNIMQNIVPFKYQAAGRSQGDFSVSILPSDDMLLLVSACLDNRCYKYTSYLLKINSNGRYEGPVQFAEESFVPYYDNKLKQLDKYNYCGVFQNTTGIYAKCIAMQNNDLVKFNVGANNQTSDLNNVHPHASNLIIAKDDKAYSGNTDGLNSDNNACIDLSVNNAILFTAICYAAYVIDTYLLL